MTYFMTSKNSGINYADVLIIFLLEIPPKIYIPNISN